MVSPSSRNGAKERQPKETWRHGVLAAERLAHHLTTQGWRVELFHRELSAGAAGARAAGREAGREALTQAS